MKRLVESFGKFLKESYVDTEEEIGVDIVGADYRLYNTGKFIFTSVLDFNEDPIMKEAFYLIKDWFEKNTNYTSSYYDTSREIKINEDFSVSLKSLSLNKECSEIKIDIKECEYMGLGSSKIKELPPLPKNLVFLTFKDLTLDNSYKIPNTLTHIECHGKECNINNSYINTYFKKEVDKGKYSGKTIIFNRVGVPNVEDGDTENPQKQTMLQKLTSWF